MQFSGMSPDGILPEIVEYDDHPGSSAFSSIPTEVAAVEPHPLFSSFIGAAMTKKLRLV